jgi:hypothetical protein
MMLRELQTMQAAASKNKRVVTLHHWFENIEYLKRALDVLSDGKVRTVHYTLFNLISENHVQLLSNYPMRPLFEISIESSFREVRRACGKPPYTNAELEAWLDMLFRCNRRAIVEIYLMIGLPQQTPAMVMEEVAYADRLLAKYGERDFNVYLCPMRPFLDPGSVIYDHPEKFGYKILFRTLREYEKALTVLHWKDSLNYETKWMSREQFVDISYAACRELALVKKRAGKLPNALAESIVTKIDDTVDLLSRLEQYKPDSLPDDIRREILAYNKEILRSTASQQSPFTFSAYKNWYE